ncbi:MAG: carboxypeptidase regulatory-like domain-containing protein [Candidatus Riflebacteria bacterium]|nr:carboxypeptidase regulatory-like domain-containing protein [Candidatus Riflebacteria bacterium]
MLLSLALATAATAAENAKLEVTVRGADRRGLAGVLVQVLPESVTRSTDPSGVAVFDVPKETMLTVTVSSRELSPLSLKKTVPATADWATAGIAMAAPAAGGSRLEGWHVGAGRMGASATSERSLERPPARGGTRCSFKVVFSRANLPVAGASIELARADGTVVAETTTDDEGRASVAVPDGTRLTVTVFAEGYADHRAALPPVRAGTTREVTVRLRREL